MKRITSVLALILTALLVGQSTANAAPFIPIGFAPSSDRQAIVVQDLPDGPDFISMISKNNVNDASETEENPHFCKSLTTNGCSLTPEATMSVASILPKCADSAMNCVEGLKIRKADGTVVEAKFVKQFPGFTFDGIPSLEAPGGSTPSLWEAPGAPNSGGTEKYVVTVTLGWSYVNSKMTYRAFTARVMPVKDTYGQTYRPSEVHYHIQEMTGRFQSNHDNGEQGTNYCAATDTGYCAEKAGFLPGTSAELSMRVSNKVTGWLHGRIANPEIAVSAIDSKYNRMVIAGEPVEVPTMYAEFEQSKMSNEFLNAFRNLRHSGGGFNSRSEWFEFSSSNSGAFYMIKALGEAVKDTAAGTRSFWSVKSIPADNNQSECLVDNKRLVGIVTTNSMAYSGSAPSFSGGFLNYEVAGLHYMPDGKTEVEGSYDLALRSDAARCLYGFSKAPISATISVTGSGGEQKTAVTQVSEKDGWLKLTARGFTFSSPTISVKLTQKSVKKTTITCKKGKLTKKVTAIGPKCPVGYKKA